MSFSGHAPRKRFGQHWLIDDQVLDKIVSAANLKAEDRVLEVGPGRGALTKKLLDSEASFIYAVELDRDLVDGLKNRFADNSRFSLEEGDILSTSLVPPDGISANKVVANIPYNITGPLLSRLIGDLVSRPEICFECLVLLLQKEVAERILAQPGSRNFSAMSVRIQLLANCYTVCDVPSSCFQPSPKVDSKVIVINPLNPDFTFDPLIVNHLDKLLRIAFRGRRKKLRNTIGVVKSPFFSIESLAENIGISLDQRPQEIKPSEWLDLAKGLKSAHQ